MAPIPTFRDRFAYARLVYHFRTGKSPTNAEIGKALGRSGQWVTQRADRADPPPDYYNGVPVHAKLAAFLAVDQAWLIRGAGAPPMPDLWESWVADRFGPPKSGKRSALLADVIPGVRSGASGDAKPGKGKPKAARG